MAEELNRIIQIICSVGNVSAISPDQDFYEAGVSSIASLTLLMELEAAFEVSIPDDRFVSARTARAIHEVVSGLRQQAA